MFGLVQQAPSRDTFQVTNIFFIINTWMRYSASPEIKLSCSLPRKALRAHELLLQLCP